MPGEEAPFAEQLRRLRESSGLTQEELASRAGLTAKAVSALERGERRRPYPHTVRSPSDALGPGDEDRLALLASVRKRGETSPLLPPFRARRSPYRRRRSWAGAGSSPRSGAS